MHKLTTQEFIDRANKIHQYKYDYSLVDYKHSKEKVKVICQIHGLFNIRPVDHLIDEVGCVLCNNPNRIPLGKEKFVEKANKVHNNKFDYSLVEYKNNDTKVKIICPNHGIFEQTPQSHLKQNVGCTKCQKIHSINVHSKTTQYFITKSNNIHKYKYDYSLVNYKSNKDKVKIICPNHGIFEQKAANHVRGMGCPICNSSKGELKIKYLLEKNNIKYTQQKTFNDCRGIKNKLPFDFYLPSYNMVIEYDGRQHFEEIKHFGGKEKLNRTQLNDSIKSNYCKVKNIKIMRIKFSDNIENIIENYISSVK